MAFSSAIPLISLIAQAQSQHLREVQVSAKVRKMADDIVKMPRKHAYQLATSGPLYRARPHTRIYKPFIIL